jgi:hypothetical protein
MTQIERFGNENHAIIQDLQQFSRILKLAFGEVKPFPNRGLPK